MPLSEDRRIFTPIDRASYKWKREYNKRTAVERVNSRIDQVLGFENHTIRGIKKMTVRCGLALCVMLAMALGRIKE
ncbi:transposase [Weizmannia sp. FSL W8-0676]